MADLPQNSIKLEGTRKLFEGLLWFPTGMNSNLKHIYLYYRLGDIIFKNENTLPRIHSKKQEKVFPVITNMN